MNILYIRIVFLLIGVGCTIWGGRITFSDSYFKYWQDTYWKEKGGNQWSKRSVDVNRWGSGLGTLMLGLGFIYLAIFQIH
jgi:hypothetical protein